MLEEFKTLQDNLCMQLITSLGIGSSVQWEQLSRQPVFPWALPISCCAMAWVVRGAIVLSGPHGPVHMHCNQYDSVCYG